MYSVVMKVTPQMAQSWLQTNVRNRRLRQGIVAQYADDMKNGKWNLTHQGIAFNKAGNLTDGQHRLTAVVRSGCTVEMMVTFEQEDTTHVDGNLRRSVADALYMGGAIESDSVINSTHVQALIGFIVRRSSKAEYKMLTPEKRLGVYLAYKPFIDRLSLNVLTLYKVKYDGCRNTRCAAINYAMLCAYHSGVSLDDLTIWCKIVRSGDPFDKDYNTQSWYHSVLVYRKWLSTALSTTDEDNNEIMLKAMSSIRHFVNHDNVTRVTSEKVYDDLPVTKEMLMGG